MTIALIDNGSLEPAAHANLRSVATALSDRTGATIHAVSWKHSDRAGAAWTLAPFVRAQFAAGERDFVFVPFFISAQGAIGSALRHDLENLQRELGDFQSSFHFVFTDGLAARGAIAPIVAARIRETISAQSDLSRTPPVIVVDHGGPSPASATLRDEIAAEIRALLAGEIGPLAAASMEGAHPPLLADQLRAPDFATAPALVIAPLFLSPGRHAGPEGDIARICRDASRGIRCHITALVGTHPLAIDALAVALKHTLSNFHAPTFA